MPFDRSMLPHERSNPRLAASFAEHASNGQPIQTSVEQSKAMFFPTYGLHRKCRPPKFPAAALCYAVM